MANPRPIKKDFSGGANTYAQNPKVKENQIDNTPQSYILLSVLYVPNIIISLTEP